MGVGFTASGSVGRVVSVRVARCMLSISLELGADM